MVPMSMIKIRIRAIVGIMMFLGYFLIYIVRYNLSVHILEMTRVLKKGPWRYGNNTELLRARSTNIRFGSYLTIISLDNWRIAILLSAYYIGYVICFPIFHNWGDSVGPTWVVGIAGLTSGTLNCLTPASAYFNYWALFTVRIIKGFCAGAMLPSMVQLLRHWVPPTERQHFMWAYCGITTGTCSTFLLCAAIHYYSRWSVGFYITGVLQMIWSTVWFVVVVDYPSKHPFISAEELDYLNNAIGAIFTIKLTNSEAPWRSILKSVPFWALCTLNFGYAWIIISLSIHGPLYYCSVIDYSIYSASALTALPFLLRLILGTMIIQAFHWYKHNSNNVKQIKLLRKYFIVVSHVLPGLIVVSTWMMPIVPGPILLTIAVALTAAGMDLTLDLCYELSPTFVNSINTVIKMIGNVPGIIISLTVGEITHKYRNSPYVWKHIWCFHGVVLLVSGIIFLIWGQTQTQSWNATRHQRIQPPVRVKPTLSIMSNIIEVDEDDASNKQQFHKNSSLLKPFKLLQVKSSHNTG